MEMNYNFAVFKDSIFLLLSCNIHDEVCSFVGGILESILSKMCQNLIHCMDLERFLTFPL